MFITNIFYQKIINKMLSLISIFIVKYLIRKILRNIYYRKIVNKYYKGNV